MCLLEDLAAVNTVLAASMSSDIKKLIGRYRNSSFGSWCVLLKVRKDKVLRLAWNAIQMFHLFLNWLRVRVRLTNAHFPFLLVMHK